MAIPVQMPKMGISVESCVLTKWHKKQGDKVEKGDLLFTYETDKTTVDEEAQDSGTLIAVFYEEGDDVPAMKYVAVLGKEGEDYSEFAPVAEAPAVESAPAAAPVAKVEAAAAPTPAAAAPVSQDGRLKISPRARVLAAKSGVDPSRAMATGAEGRITESDIKNLINSATGTMAGMASGEKGSGIGGRLSSYDAAVSVGAANAPVAEFTDEKIPVIRKTIAKNMTMSLSTMAQVTNTASFDATSIMAFRKLIKEKGATVGAANITLNDIVLFAVAKTLLKHKSLNANFFADTDTIRYFANANIGMAVDTPKGLMVPTLFSADKMSLSELSVIAKESAKKCQEGTMNPDGLKGGSFTVSNLGSLGVETFTPVINPPQTGILGVGAIKDAVRLKDGQISVYPSMTLSLTYDHRIVDGAPAARFLKDLCDMLENFTLALTV